MPVIMWAYLGYVAGLLIGFSRSWMAATAAVGAAACLAIWHDSVEVWGIGLLLGAGILIASVTPLASARSFTPQINSDTTSYFGRQRARAAHTIDAVFQQDAPLARALLIADKTQLPKPLKQQYVAAGIAHRLSISGLHVALLATAVELFVYLLRLPRRTAAAASVVVISIYVALIGFPLPAVRAWLMFATSGLSRFLQRPTSKWAILAGCGFVPLVDPQTILTVGYQLNMVGVAGFLAGSSAARRYLRPRLSGWRRRIAQSVFISTVATVITAPLIAWWFGQISLIAPVTNLLVDPLLSVAQPLLFLGLLCAPCHWAATLCADAVHPLFTLVDRIAAVASAIPYASPTLKPTVVEAVLAGLASSASLIACISRSPARAVLVACSAITVLVWIG